MRATLRNLALAATTAMMAKKIFRCKAQHPHSGPSQPLRRRWLRDELAATMPTETAKNHQLNICPAPISSIDRIVAFGDSFSDVGNVFRASNHTEPPPPVYFRGRYSNGRNYVDFIGQNLNVSVSTSNVYAWGGATTSNALVPGFSTFLNRTVPSVEDQVQRYLESGNDNDGTRDRSSVTLHIIVAGYNDYWWYANDQNRTLTVTEMVDHVISNLRGSVRRLASSTGARKLLSQNRMSRQIFLVGNLPPMALMPDAKSKSADVVRVYEQVTQLHNLQLAREVDSFLDEKLRQGEVKVLPVYESLIRLVESTCLGFTSVSSACYVDDDTSNMGCDDPYSHIFLDSWHPMTWTHQALAQAVLTACKSHRTSGENHR